MVRIGHASIDENGKVQGGKAGDQTKMEVCRRDWYNKGWNKLIRAKNPTVAEKIATTCEAACDNDNIGYDQYQRLTLSMQAKKANHDLAKIKSACECDCSSLMAECAIAAGLKVSPSITTRNMVSAFQATGKVEILTDSKHLNSSDYLKRGDILVKEGSHTVCVLTNGSKVSASTTVNKDSNQKVTSAKSKDSKITGKYKTTGNLNMRYVPGGVNNNNVVCIIPFNAIVQCYGYYTTVNDVKWYLVAYEGKTGFVSSKYLMRQ